MPPEPPDEPEVPEPMVVSSKKHVTAWLIRVAMNKANDHHRKEKQEQKKINKLKRVIELGYLKTKTGKDFTCVRTRDFYDGEFDGMEKSHKEEKWWSFFRDYLKKQLTDNCCHCLMSRFYEILPEFAGEYIAKKQVKRINLVRDCRDVCPSLRIPNENKARQNATSTLETCLNRLGGIADQNGYTLDDYDPRKS